MKTVFGLVTAVGLTLAALASLSAQSDKGAKKVDTRVFELRTYHVYPGKMTAMHARFRDHTCKLLEKHGMTLVGFWSPTDTKEAERLLIYLVAHPSQEAAMKNWKAFGADPDWIKAKTESEKAGKIVEKVDRVFMNPTDYSKMK